MAGRLAILYSQVGSGGLRVQMGDRSLTRFRTQKNAVLLAYLAYYRHQQHPREVLSSRCSGPTAHRKSDATA
jgi:hypothetical protein